MASGLIRPSEWAGQDLGTVEAARRVLRAFFAISKAWRLEPAQQAALLGVSESACLRWRNGEVDAALPADTLERLGYILGIYASLQILLPIQERADAWVHQPNAAELFGGQPAIALMLSSRPDALRVVAGYLSTKAAES